MTGSTCDFLPWDSQFFNARIARVRGGVLTPALLASAEAWCRNERIDCLYFLSDRVDDAAGAWLEGAGFVHVDTRVTLAASLAPVPAASVGGVRQANDDDIPGLREIAAATHHATRFYADRRLAAAADAMYAFWIENSVKDPSIHVLVPDASPVSGYITCYEAQVGSGQIGLLGVAAAARGRGHAGRLVGAALEWMIERGMTTATVVTQGRNEAARRVYERCGFAPSLEQRWYHRWFTPGRSQ